MASDESRLAREEFQQLQERCNELPRSVEVVVEECLEGSNNVFPQDTLDYTQLKRYLDQLFDHHSSETTTQALFKHLSKHCSSTGQVYLRDLLAFLSLLQGGISYESKLDMLFRLYSPDGASVERPLADTIVEHMLAVAEGLGRNTSDLRPIAREALDNAERNGVITRADWNSCKLATVPLRVLLQAGRENVDESHEWYAETFRQLDYRCNVCLKTMKSGMCCTFCQYAVHEQCVDSVTTSCVETCVNESSSCKVLFHHWVANNCTGKCHKCSGAIGGKRLGLHCRWCQLSYHDACAKLVPPKCKLGSLKEHILPPTSIRRDESGSIKFSQPEGCRPLLVFVNRSSGSEHGAEVLRKMRSLLNPRQVCDMMTPPVGPAKGLQLLKDLPDARILICGGDGTVGWINTEIDMLKCEPRPPVAVMPLGTGNDFARVLGWGIGYNGENITEWLGRVAQAPVVMMDRFDLALSDVDTTCQGAETMPNAIMNCYLSIGIDALTIYCQAARRQQHGSSKLQYLLAFAHAGPQWTRMQHDQPMEIECDGVALPPRQLAALQIINTPSVYGGMDFWRSAQLPSAQQQGGGPSSSDFVKQDFGDGRIELVGMRQAWRAFALLLRTSSFGRRVAQCSNVVIRTRHLMPMHVDGEAWLQAPCTITISRRDQLPCLQAPGKKPS